MISSQQIGNEAEKEFIKEAKSCGFKVRRASPRQDMRHHYDVILEDTNGTIIKVDIKGLKRSARNGQSLVDSMWIEFTNVRGNKGWIHGQADWIAQKVNVIGQPEFFIFKRKDLLKQADKLVRWDLPVVDSPRDAEYRLYRRKGRLDLVTRIPLVDLKPFKIWGIKERRD